MSRLFNFYRVFIITITLFLVCIASRVNAADSDNFTLTLSAGTPTVAPNPAAVNETATFRFTVTLHGNGQHIEEVPPGIKEIQYTVNCADGIITANNPDMLISADKHSASKTVKQLYSSVSSSTQFPQTGDFSLSLSVTVIFMDNSQLSKSHTISVKVVSATLTVYAKKPETIVLYSKVLKISIPHCLNDPGHSFWKIDYSALPGELSYEETTRIGIPYGHYPKSQLPPNKTVTQKRDGAIRDDSTHIYDQSASFSIKPTNAQKAIKETNRLINDNSLKYHITNTLAKNCTGQCVRISGSFARSKAPNGIGVIGWVLDENDLEGVYSPFPFSNPYHHAMQIENLSKQIRQ